jgi:hypothetical protein
MTPFSRREFVALSASSGLLALAGLPLSGIAPTGPSIFWTNDPNKSGLRTVDDVRLAVTSGRSAEIYMTIRELVDSDLGRPPVTPSDPMLGRDAVSIQNNSPDFLVTNEAAQRMLRAALVTVVEDDASFSNVAIEQMKVLFDARIWEGWIDKAHLRFGHPAGLRTGMLSEAVGLSYDWLRPYLSQSDRTFIVEGLDRSAVQPFLKSMEQEAWWLNDLNNWLTTIVGGLGIAGMALGQDHPDADFLVSYAAKRMEEYLSIYGPNGEFNESVHYANATLRPVAFFEAYRYWSRGSANRLVDRPFPQTCFWQLYMTLPPGRVAAFGDSHTDVAPWTKHFAAVAAATQDQVLQWFYLNNSGGSGDSLELLWLDATLEATSPDELLTKGKSFPAHGGCFVSRSDWDKDAAACIMYGKSGREENHEHNDAGQICIDGNGERLIVDLGSPKPTYPHDFFDEGRYEYYIASARGHNVMLFDDKELRYPIRERGEPMGSMATDRSGRVLKAVFDDDLGAIWQVDLSPAYRDVISVTRTAIHLLPGFIAVLDQAELGIESKASLRWHTVVAAEPDSAGNFAFSTPSSRLSARVVPLDGHGQFALRKHEYKAPFDHGRGGVLLKQHNEPYVEMTARGSSFSILTLFAVTQSSSQLEGWSTEGSGWGIQVAGDKCRVDLRDGLLSVSAASGNRRLVTGI